MSEPDQITVALTKAQAAIASVKMDKENPHFRSKYASLAAIREAILKPLADNGLAVTQTFRLDGEAKSLILVTTLRHVSGQTIVSEYPMPQSGTPQAMGSAATYARRYSLSALLSLASEEDDDGNAAEETTPHRRPKAAPKEKEDVSKKIDAAAVATADSIIAEINKCVSLADIDHLKETDFFKNNYAALPLTERARVASIGQKKREELTPAPIDDKVPY